MRSLFQDIPSVKNFEFVINHSLVRLVPVVIKVVRLDTLFRDKKRLFYFAALNCYSGLSDKQLLEKAEKDDLGKITRFLEKNIIKTGHFSVLEHGPYSFLVSGISRACSHQLVRHRHFSFSQQSQRYQGRDLKKEQVTETPFIIPPAIRANKKLLVKYIDLIKKSVESYYYLRTADVFPEDARMVYPNAIATRIVISGNLRAFMEMAPKRICARAQWEIDMVVTEIIRHLSKDHPEILDKVGPTCYHGKCNQGKRTCGVPLKGNLKDILVKKTYPHDKMIWGMR